MRWSPFTQYLPVLVLAVFVWGCAAPPASPPERGDDLSTRDRQAKSTDRQKKKPGNKPKEAFAAEEQSGPLPTGPVLEEPSAEESVVSRRVFYYDYFPDAEVYYDTIRHLFFYQENSEWLMSVALPTAFQEKIGPSVRLQLSTARPYSLHQEHRIAHPPEPDRHRF